MSLKINTLNQTKNQYSFSGKNKTQKKNNYIAPIAIIATSTLALGGYIYAKKTNKLEKVNSNTKNIVNTAKYLLAVSLGAAAEKLKKDIQENKTTQVDDNKPQQNPIPDNSQSKELGTVQKDKNTAPDNIDTKENNNNPTLGDFGTNDLGDDEFGTNDLGDDDFGADDSGDDDLGVDNPGDDNIDFGEDDDFDKFLDGIKKELAQGDAAKNSLNFRLAPPTEENNGVSVDLDFSNYPDDLFSSIDTQQKPQIIRTEDGFIKRYYETQNGHTGIFALEIEEEYKNDKLTKRITKDTMGTIKEIVDFENRQVIIPCKPDDRKTVYDFKKKRIYDYIINTPKKPQIKVLVINPKLKIGRITLSGIHHGIWKEASKVNGFTKYASNKYNELKEKYDL